MKYLMWNLTPEEKGKVEQGRERSSGLFLLKNLVQALEKKREEEKKLFTGREAAGV